MPSKRREPAELKAIAAVLGPEPGNVAESLSWRTIGRRIVRDIDEAGGAEGYARFDGNAFAPGRFPFSDVTLFQMAHHVRTFPQTGAAAYMRVACDEPALGKLREFVLGKPLPGVEQTTDPDLGSLA